jgi:hypothetical protein
MFMTYCKVIVSNRENKRRNKCNSIDSSITAVLFEGVSADACKDNRFSSDLDTGIPSVPFSNAHNDFVGGFTLCIVFELPFPPSPPLPPSAQNLYSLDRGT